ncbi:reverse transcriptase family protein [Desulfolutivibrio sp.]|uniref:reverse transcriptase family protein n=1 Tax=Desulfolutivibrio sp. TaxID=2773296 RepID=UPI002F96251E
MSLPSSQQYRSQGRREGVDETTLNRAVETIERIRRTDPRLTPVLTLRHLSYLAETPYGYLRHIVSRNSVQYRHVRLKKHLPGRKSHRIISIPSANLMNLQRWIAQRILKYIEPSSASFAYHPGSSPVMAAEEHCGCSWLMKVDIQDFFHSIAEGRVSKIFFSAGYPRLLSFELARICTMQYGSRKFEIERNGRWTKIPHYWNVQEGVLPQGAPTSPMLSNLVVRHLDNRLIDISKSHGVKFSRYSDDLAFSCKEKKSAKFTNSFKRIVLSEISREGFRHNHRKTVVRGSGDRRIVLGMLVDGATPRLPREFKDLIRLHLYYLSSKKFGPANHATHLKISISTLYHRLLGLIGWATRVEPEYGANCLNEFKKIKWPPIRPGYSLIVNEEFFSS